MTVPRPEWTRAGNDFGFLWAELGIAAAIDRVREDRDTLSGHITFRTAAGAHLHLTKLNLMAPRPRADLTKYMRERAPGPEWDEVLEQICTIILREWYTPPRPIDLHTITMPAASDIYLDSRRMIPSGQMTGLYGPGESAKSLLALGLGLSIASGVPFAQVQPVKIGDVIWLDYEDVAWVAASRQGAFMRGMGITGQPPLHYYEMDRPIFEVSEWLRAEVARTNAVLVIVDSYVPSVGADPETADAAQRFHRAIRMTKAATLVITHISKTDMEKRRAMPFGSVMVTNLARSLWEISKASDEREDARNPNTPRELRIGAYQRKNNFGRRGQEAFRLRLSLEGGLVTRIEATEAHIEDDSELSEKAGLAQLIENALKRGGQMTAGELAEWTGQSPDNVGRTLRRRSDKFVRLDGGAQGGRGREGKWGMRARGREEEA
jgi:hypothetical protein